MTTSGSYSFSVTRDDIFRQALLNIGKLDAYDIVDAVQAADMQITLNMMCKQWMGKADFAPGLKVWTRKHGHLFLSSTTGQYTVGPGATGWTNSYLYTTLAAGAALSATTLVLASITGMTVGDHIGIEQSDGSLFWTTIATLPSTTITIAAGLTVGASSGAQIFTYTTVAQQPLFIETAILRDKNLDDTPIKVPTVQDYDYLPQKADPTSQQDPTAIYYEFQLTNSILYTDAGSAQDVTKHLVLTYQEPVQDFTTALDNPSYPQEWFLPLCWGLSKLVCPMFNRPWTPLMQENFITTLRVAQQKDAERSSLYFQPGAED
jgi:hypothetical protein